MCSIPIINIYIRFANRLCQLFTQSNSHKLYECSIYMKTAKRFINGINNLYININKKITLQQY